MADAAPGHPTWPSPPSATPPSPSGRRRLGAAAGAAAVLAVVAGIIVAAFVFRPRVMRVASDSMAPTLRSGNHILVTRNVGTIARGDVVLFRPPHLPDRSHVFRVIGLPGEQFRIVGGVVHVDGKPLAEPYVAAENRSFQDYGPYQLPANQYFLMGDNRANAADSRYIGAIDRDAIWGKWVPW